jgi:hypothetical protein
MTLSIQNYRLQQEGLNLAVESPDEGRRKKPLGLSFCTGDDLDSLQ